MSTLICQNNIPLNSVAMISVQELIKEPLMLIPQQYIRFGDQGPSKPILFDHSNLLPTLPILDMKQLESGYEELQKLHSACKDWGFFQVVNHGVSSSLMEKLRNEIEEFYKLPIEEKVKYKIRPGDVEGYGSIPRREGKLDWGDRLFMTTNPLTKRKPHLFPELPSSLRDTLEHYIAELQEVGKKLLMAMARALNIEREEWVELFEDGLQSMRMTYYPQCPQPELVMGLTPHSDATGITILNQLNGVDGLEIMKDGVWIPVNCQPDAFVVNVGDILEILSNGIYSSIEHRAMVNSTKERISIAFFMYPKFEADIGPVSSLINLQNPPLFKKIGMEQYLEDFFSRKLDGKSHLEYMKIKTDQESHGTPVDAKN
ncbi:protein SRG1-like [Tripterygium wilfordii]|uniref:Protein SRG1-like n=1 Tax=Tripterygium wilfordii TaxID=458696 RepID=A0A7J7DGW6_TRIWF|nr:protein SRG1-like [Tripterygium wilfordii]KAF5745597.1 protein SRG1-like [Tripterygium wilfordii]